MRKPIDLSIIVCTHNRALMLRDTIESFLHLKWKPETRYELLVVDNNSKDDTQQVVREFIEKMPQTIRYLFEERIGLSHARNSGIKAARGEIIAFTDDDVEFDELWGQEIVETFSRYTEASCVGGKNIPVFPQRRPDWINESLFQIYGDIKMGEAIRYIEFPDHPYGLNMAFRSSVFEGVGLFNTELGRKENNLLSGEDTDLFYRIFKSGLKTLYSPHITMKHKIPSGRTEKKWILKRHYWQGSSMVMLEQMMNPKTRGKLFSEALADLKNLMRWILTDFVWSPRKVYWHLSTLKFENWMDNCHALGKVRQKLYLALFASNCNVKEFGGSVSMTNRGDSALTSERRNKQ
jgi:glycosyltransferase involved in cell wall biosynthesis